MKLNPPNIHPKEDEIVLTVGDGPRNHGFVGCARFKAGNWYMLPGEHKYELKEKKFFWIEFDK